MLVVAQDKKSVENASRITYNGSVTTDADTGAGTMGHGALAVGVELLVEVAKEEAGAKGSLPGVCVHLEAVELDQVDHDTASITAETEVAIVGS